MQTNHLWQSVKNLLDIEMSPVSHAERLASIGGGFTSILLILLVSRQFVGPTDATLIVASMGASAVLLFAVPHGRLSQPWPVLGGHMLSALVGVACAQLVAEPMLAAALAVGLAIGAMHYLRCIHPPGGATALTAVVGGTGVHELGYGFLVMPVLINVLVILIVAVLFNYPFAWRRYPAALQQRKKATNEPKIPNEGYPAISHSDFVFALSEIDSFIDVTEQDLVRIYELATRRKVHPTDQL
jgi:CBS domain-containing membrane protein